MGCQKVPWGDGAVIFCGATLKPAPNCSAPNCTKPSTIECDWPAAEGKTCDKPVCGDHAEQVGPNKHWCRDHSIEHAKSQLRTGN